MSDENNLSKTSKEGSVKEGRRRGHWIFWTIATLVIFIGAWIFLSPTSHYLKVSGKVISISHRAVMRHDEGGIVSQIYVKNGSVVKKDQVLIQLDEDDAKLNLTLLKNRVNELSANKARLLAERDGKDKIIFPDRLMKLKNEKTVAAVLENQEQLFKVNRDTYQNRMSIYLKRIEQLRLQIQGLQAQLKANDDQYKIVLMEMKEVQALYDKKLIDLPRLLALKRQKATLEGEKGEKISELSAIKQKIGETEHEIIMLKVDRQKDILKELLDTHKELIDTLRKEMTAKNILERTSIKAPQDGVVVNLSVDTIGSSVRAGEPVLEIIPIKEILLVEVRISERDVDLVKKRQVAKIKFVGFKMHKKPLLIGRVAYISKTVMKESGQSYYLVRIEVSKKRLSRLPSGLLVKAGMPVTVLIDVGSKTFLKHIYFLIKDAFGTAF